MADPTTSSRAPQGLGPLPTQSPVLTYCRGLNITLLTLFAFPVDQGHNILKTSGLPQEGQASVQYDPAQQLEITHINTFLHAYQMTRNVTSHIHTDALS